MMLSKKSLGKRRLLQLLEFLIVLLLFCTLNWIKKKESELTTAWIRPHYLALLIENSKVVFAKNCGVEEVKKELARYGITPEVLEAIEGKKLRIKASFTPGAFEKFLTWLSRKSVKITLLKARFLPEVKKIEVELITG